MSDQNEFSGYSLDELESKKRRFLKMQKMVLIFSLTSAVILATVALIKQADQFYPVVGLLLILGIGYPRMTFGPILKKIQQEIDARP